MAMGADYAFALLPPQNEVRFPAFISVLLFMRKQPLGVTFYVKRLPCKSIHVGGCCVRCLDMSMSNGRLYLCRMNVACYGMSLA